MYNALLPSPTQGFAPRPFAARPGEARMLAPPTPGGASQYDQEGGSVASGATMSPLVDAPAGCVSGGGSCHVGADAVDLWSGTRKERHVSSHTYNQWLAHRVRQ